MPILPRIQSTFRSLFRKEAMEADLLQRVLRWGGTLVGIGVVVGIALSVPGSRLLQGLLFGVQPLEPLTYTAALAFLVVVSLLACALPALRASRVDPVTALRGE